MNAAIPRAEHPRPDFMRDTFLNLNGEWQFAYDDGDEGLRAGWQKAGVALPLRITVPFAYQTRMSGLGPTDEIHPILWYRRGFALPEEMAGKRVLLRFGAVDYRCRVYVNGELAGGHEGGYTPFALDITGLLVEGENDLCLRVEDAPDCAQPRGKQHWDRGLMGCWYTPVSGIWQTVYLEAVGPCAMMRAHVIPDIDRQMFTAEIALDREPESEMTLELTATFEGRLCRRACVTLSGRRVRVPVSLSGRGGVDPIELWFPERPALYDLELRLMRGDEVVDRVRTYFGMRRIEVRAGQVFLNHRKLYQRLVLDQGYWPDSLLTPPSDEAIRRDVELTRELGYNGARKHQKVEDPRYYYWADRLGLLVWGELPSAYDFSFEAVRGLSDTLAEFIDRDFNHPSIICWVPLNESWGVTEISVDPRQQAAARMLVQQARALDGTRLCSSNDGWEQVEGDICGLHDYAPDGAIIARHFESRRAVEQGGCDARACYARGGATTGDEAFMITEYGGIAFDSIGPQGMMGGVQTWGYHGKVGNEEAFFERFASVTRAIRAIPYCQGYCYTQLTDVMQEINGVLTPDRKSKVDMRRFAAINRREA